MSHENLADLQNNTNMFSNIVTINEYTLWTKLELIQWGSKSSQSPKQEKIL